MAKSAMSDAPKEQEPETVSPAEEEVETEEVENEHEATGLYELITEALSTECHADETAEEFKIRVVQEFSDMSMWPDEKYEELPKEVQDWVYDATTTHKSNMNKKRKKALPALPGLDSTAPEKQTRGRRASLVDEPKRRTRANGEDCLTRTMKILVINTKPEDIKAVDLVKTLEEKYGKSYSTAAVRYAQQAFLTARELLNAEHATA